MFAPISTLLRPDLPRSSPLRKNVTRPFLECLHPFSTLFTLLDFKAKRGATHRSQGPRTNACTDAYPPDGVRPQHRPARAVVLIALRPSAGRVRVRMNRSKRTRVSCAFRGVRAARFEASIFLVVCC